MDLEERGMNDEEMRLHQTNLHTADWKRWGPYLAERAWGTVREDYSPDGSAWEYFPHDHARSKAYRWNEDGLLGICDRGQYLCFALALWNHKDPILKERLFGLTGNQGNHGEDVKEYYFFLDNTPTHSYMKALYKYPQAAYPYQQLIDENARKTKEDPEYELFDTGIFNENRYFDVFVEYAKEAPEDILIRITVVNRGPEAAPLTLLPTLWFRNTWIWGEHTPVPNLTAAQPENPAGKAEAIKAIRAEHPIIGEMWLLCQSISSGPELLFTNNETNYQRLYGPSVNNSSPYVKDGINDYIVQGRSEAVNPEKTGTKAAACYRLTIGAGETCEVRLRLTRWSTISEPLGVSFERIFRTRKQEADDFYAAYVPDGASEDLQNIQRQAFAGMLWSKQFYHYNVATWLDGDPGFPPPPPQRKSGRNHDWRHLDNFDVFSMPDTWEYPWYAAWDLAFHCIVFALIDPAFAKRQLILLCREWAMHPNGQLPAYEWNFNDVNPPVHAWAALRVYRIEHRLTGKADLHFLERIFHKLLLNFTWWVNRKDPEGRNVFQGGFLGMDNIGVFDRNAPLPSGETLEQSDGTAWMGFFCLSMFAIAVELARDDPAYEDMAIKFFEHFLFIAGAINNIGDSGISLWDEQDHFFYDVLRMPDGTAIPLRARSLVGLIPILAVETIEDEDLKRMSEFRERAEWFLEKHPELASLVCHLHVKGDQDRRLLALVRPERLVEVLRRMLDPNEFLSDYGIRSVSKYHEQHPYVLNLNQEIRSVDYEPAESRTTLFGGNSNWRGPIWFPINYLIIEALQRFDYYFRDSFKVECPTGSGNQMTLWEVATELSHRLVHIFLRDGNGRRAVFGDNETFQTDPNWKDYIPFHEYFHGDTGKGLGASHQTGWTGLIAKLIEQSGA
ncbi:Mannosyl oligosaccharide glucosidase [Chthonomonas calidirosea]|uniref:Mannosyl oligosaccharide glucosidase n=2 Tax=Chthonomonas TaxID=1077265 RepID=S0ETE6_CHTCT|nr:Mannosyl oligosaccharide glucosidase [Chthonomonas calidirosea T49]CEK13969.1 Mannosyl oligosaccharide glucosidase [Chthonomonas calidirosea]